MQEQRLLSAFHGPAVVVRAFVAADGSTTMWCPPTTPSYFLPAAGLELSQVHMDLTSPADGDDCGDCPQSSSGEGASLLHVLAVDPARCSSDVSVRDTLQHHPLLR